MGTNTNVNAHVNTLATDRCTRVVEDVLDTHTQTHTHTHTHTHIQDMVKNKKVPDVETTGGGVRRIIMSSPLCRHTT
jgi:hypothetical protein